jgi:hypothetical protein
LIVDGWWVIDWPTSLASPACPAFAHHPLLINRSCKPTKQWTHHWTMQLYVHDMQKQACVWHLTGNVLVSC